MIRVNLLPRATSSATIFGTRVDSRYVREFAFGLFLVTLAAVMAYALQTARIVRSGAESTALETAIEARSSERASADGIARDLARYREIDRSERRFRRTGTDVALRIARLGNAVPAGIRLDTLQRDAAGYAIAGASRNVAAIADALHAFARVPSLHHPAIVTIEGRGPASDSIRFSAHVAVAADTDGTP